MKTALIIFIVVFGVMALPVIGRVLLEMYVRWRTTGRLRRLFGPEYKQRILDRYSEIRDLTPVKNVTGAGDVKSKSKSTTSGTGTIGSH